MKKSFLFLLSLALSLQVGFSQIVFAEEMDSQEVYKALQRGVKEIKSKKPYIPNSILKKDIAFIKKNWQKTKLAKKYLHADMVWNVTVDAWVDIRARGSIQDNMPLRSVDSIDRYGILRVNSKPKTGATVILNKTDIWDKKTNTYKGVHSGTHTVEVELAGYEADPKTKTVPEGGDVSVTFELKKKKQ